jgi:hypothetical protein
VSASLRAGHARAPTLALALGIAATAATAALPARAGVAWPAPRSWSLAGETAILSGGAGARWQAGLGLGEIGPLHAELRAGALSRFAHGDWPSGRSEGRLWLGVPGLGGWLAAGRTWDFEDGPAAAVVSLGGWAEREGLTVTAQLEQIRLFENDASPAPPHDSSGAVAVPVDRTRSPQSALAGDAPSGASARLGVRWARSRWTLDLAGGVTGRRSVAPYRWAQGALAMTIHRGLAAFVTAGSPAPQWQSLDPVGDRRASLGLRLTGWSRVVGVAARPAGALEWRMRRVEGEWHSITVRAPGAHAVETMGDVTGWVPVALQRVGDDRWRLGLRMTPGVHELNLRVDGGPWLPPPGVPSRADGYSGEVGVIVVE